MAGSKPLVLQEFGYPADAQYYGLPNSAEFKSYLCSIGLRKADGTPKAGWNAFTQAATDTGLP
jgi:hypothetical protein